MKDILIEDNKFKSVIISVTYVLPLNNKENSKNTLVALLLGQGCEKYKSEKEIRTKLAQLYNSEIGVNINKVGDNYVFTFFLEVINKKYIGKDVLIEGLSILKNIMFNPYLENGVFYKPYVEREKKALINMIDEIKNNKIRYAISRLEEEFFKGQMYAINKYGTVKDVEKETPESIYNQYLKIINQGNVTISVSGNTDGYKNILKTVKSILKIKTDELEIKRIQKENNEKIEKTEIKNIKEYEDLNQSILCMGLKVKDTSKKDIIALLVLNAILGESAASKLFQNVREKESLAYFAKSEYIKQKEVIYIYTGINILNLEKAKTIIIKQIEDIKSGNISKEEMEAAKKHLISKVIKIKDSKKAAMNYTLKNRMMYGNKEIKTETKIKQINNISKKEVMDVAKKLNIDTIYLLGGKSKNA